MSGAGVNDRRVGLAGILATVSFLVLGVGSALWLDRVIGPLARALDSPSIAWLGVLGLAAGAIFGWLALFNLFCKWLKAE